jgi:HPt (histidine-containing phosphotransfer) domain-containing protein
VGADIACVGAHAFLRGAFAEEVAERLPHLEALRSPGRADLELARRDAHTLASSAWVVGEPELSRVAREVEHQLPGGPLDELLSLLRAWTP